MPHKASRPHPSSASQRRVQQIQIEDMVHQAAKLFGDGEGNELGVNEEYERGIAEFICRQAGLPSSHTPEIVQRIHGTAKSHRTSPQAI